MSYDLYLMKKDETRNKGIFSSLINSLFKKGQADLTPTSFAKYFSRRNHYTLADNGTQAVYDNQESGVWFTFELYKEDEEADPEEFEDTPKPDVVFNLNYDRPAIFGETAAIEISDFAKSFNLNVYDPQSEAMGEFDSKCFMDSWTSNNNQAKKTINLINAARASAIPEALLEKVKRWNGARIALQERVGEDIYVPQVYVGENYGSLTTLIIWTDAIPTVIPTFIEKILICREDMEPTKKDFLIDYDEVFFLLDHCTLVKETETAYHLPPAYDEIPVDVLALFKIENIPAPAGLRIIPLEDDA